MNKTRVQRSWSSTFVKLAIGVALLGVCVAMFMFFAEGAITVGISLLPGIVGLVLVWSAFAGSATGPCPGCNAALTSLSTGSNDGVCCDQCHRYVEGHGGELWLTEPSRVADTALFTTKLGERFAWPDGCCVCGQPSTRGIKITAVRSHAASNAATTVATGGMIVSANSTQLTIEVPHCGLHDNGAYLSAGANDRETRISFRSYPYLRAFCERNGTQPG